MDPVPIGFFVCGLALGVVVDVVTVVDTVFVTSAIVDVAGVAGLIVVVDDIFSRRTGSPVGLDFVGARGARRVMIG